MFCSMGPHVGWAHRMFNSVLNIFNNYSHGLLMGIIPNQSTVEYLQNDSLKVGG